MLSVCINGNEFKRCSASAEDVCKTQFAQLERYEKILQQAARADDQVGKKLDDNEVNLTLIGKTKQQLEAMVPYSETTRALSDECLTVKSELVKTLDELENFMIHRDEIVESHMFSSLSAEEVADELTRAGGSVQDKTIEVGECYVSGASNGVSGLYVHMF